MQVLKFGGTSLRDAEAIRHVAGIIREESAQDRIVVVCSACGGVTNALVHIVELVRAGEIAAALDEFDDLAIRHLDIAADLKSGCEIPRAPSEIHRLMAATQARIFAANPAYADQAWSDSILSFGERVSTRLIAVALRELGTNARAVDASELIMTDDVFGSATPFASETKSCVRRVIDPLLADGIVPVVTGFIGATRTGRITTLGRNSSDYSAAILAKAIGADEVTIWTDVDGVFDGDPRNAHTAPVFIEALSYDEAAELARRGARVLHPRTLEPLIEGGITARVRNTFNHRHPGSWIGPAVGSAAR